MLLSFLAFSNVNFGSTAPEVINLYYSLFVLRDQEREWAIASVLDGSMSPKMAIQILILLDNEAQQDTARRMSPHDWKK
jgi:hypothetical protein